MADRIDVNPECTLLINSAILIDMLHNIGKCPNCMADISVEDSCSDLEGDLDVKVMIQAVYKTQSKTEDSDASAQIVGKEGHSGARRSPQVVCRIGRAS